MGALDKNEGVVTEGRCKFIHKFRVSLPTATLTKKLPGGLAAREF